MGYVSTEVLCTSNTIDDQSWILDSGCTFHMTLNMDWFESFEDRDGGQVLLGNNKACRVLGIGAVRFKMFNGFERVLQDVRYVPELKRNLISLGALDVQGCSFKAENVIFCGKRIPNHHERIKGNGLYHLDGKAILGSVATGEADMARLWHLRLGHLSERGLNELSKQGVFGSKPLNILDFW